MALPVLASYEPASALPLPVKSLRQWLQGNWALLFSHPDDFASYGFEADRWLVHLRQAFSATHIRAMALTPRDTAHGYGWIHEVGGCVTVVEVDSTQASAITSDDRERAFHTAVTSATTRFVMILDDSLRPRRTFAYSASDRLPSPIELVWSAESLRLQAMKRRATVVRRSWACGQRDTHRTRLGAMRIDSRRARRV